MNLLRFAPESTPGVARDCVQSDFFGAAIVKLRRACRGMIGHLRGSFERAAVLEVSGDARRSNGMIAEARGDARAELARL